MSKLKSWWSYDAEAEKESADNPVTPLTESQRRGTFPLLTLAFGWGFLVTGLFVGGMLGNGQVFWPDIVRASFAGNVANFVIGALVGYIGYRTACNSGLLYQLVYGKIGAYIPVLVIALLLIGWQGIVVGAFGVTWAGNSDSMSFYLIAIAAGILFTITTYFGVKGLEYVSIPSVVILVAVGLYAAWLNIDQAGGWAGFLDMSAQRAAESETPLTTLSAINLVIGSWIVGAIVMPEYTRFARKAWVAIAIPFHCIARGSVVFTDGRCAGRSCLRYLRFHGLPSEPGHVSYVCRNHRYEFCALDDRGCQFIFTRDPDIRGIPAPDTCHDCDMRRPGDHRRAWYLREIHGLDQSIGEHCATPNWPGNCTLLFHCPDAFFRGGT